MTTAGPPDSSPGDESEGIRYFDFSEPFESDESEGDPFESEDPAADSPKRTWSQPSRTQRSQPERGSEEPAAHDVFEFALGDLPSHPTSAEQRGGEPGEEPRATFAPLTAYFGHEGQDAGQRARLAAAFNTARARVGEPFLALALRMPVGAPESAWFPLVEQAVRSALRSGDAVLVDRERLRVTAVLPGRGADDVRPLLADLMAYLHEHVENAAEVSHRISVFTAPGGRPFHDGAHFLAEVYGKP